MEVQSTQRTTSRWYLGEVGTQLQARVVYYSRHASPHGCGTAYYFLSRGECPQFASFNTRKRRSVRFERFNAQPLSFRSILLKESGWALKRSNRTDRRLRVLKEAN